MRRHLHDKGASLFTVTYLHRHGRWLALAEQMVEMPAAT
jgi:hypothetical protein